MPKLYPIIIRRGGIVAGDTDFTADLGTDDQGFPGALAIANGAQSLGTEDESLGHSSSIVLNLGTRNEVLSALDAISSFTDSLGTEDQAALADLTVTITTDLGTDGQAGLDAPSDILFVASLGTEDAALAAQLSSALTRALGTDGQSLGALESGAFTKGLGTETESHSAASVILGSGLADTVVQSGADWTNINNIKTESDGTLATITAAASVGSGDSYNDDMSADDFNIVGGHTGWARSNIDLIVRHDWDTTVGALSTVDHIIRATKQDGTGGFTINTRDETSASQDPLTTERFGMLGSVSGWSNAEVEGIIIIFDAACNLLVVTGGNADWRVAWAKIEVRLTRSGIT